MEPLLAQLKACQSSELVRNTVYTPTPLLRESVTLRVEVTVISTLSTQSRESASFRVRS